MFTLHIEHPITDYDTWRRAFDRFAEVRAASGVSSHTIWQPVDNPDYVLIDLNFETAGRAESFLDILRTRVWADSSESPGLAGVPATRILEVRDAATTVG